MNARPPHWYSVFLADGRTDKVRADSVFSMKIGGVMETDFFLKGEKVASYRDVSWSKGEEAPTARILELDLEVTRDDP